MSTRPAAIDLRPLETEAEVKKVVWELSAPTLIEMVLVSLVGMADMIQVGRVGPAAITSVGLTNQPMMLLQAVFQALNVGTTALVARFIGMGKYEDASETVKQTFAVTVVLAVAVSLFAGLLAPQILIFMGAEPEVLEIGVAYFRVVGFGFLFRAVAMAMASALRGAGDTRTPMTVNLWANGINIVFNWLLIWGKFGFPQWGVFGAGVATTFSMVVSSVWFVLIALKGERHIRLDFSDRFHVDKGILGRIYNVGLPAALEQLVMRTGQVFFVKVVSSLGTVTFAAHQVGMNIMSLTFMPGQAFAAASTTLVGQYLGARQPDSAEKCANTVRKMGLTVNTVMAVVFMFAGKYIAALYTNDPAVALATASVLRIVAFALPFQVVQFILAGGLRGAGDTRYPLYSTAFGMWFARVLLGWFLVNVMDMGLVGAWFGITIDQIIRGILIQLRFNTGKWKTAKV